MKHLGSTGIYKNMPHDPVSHSQPFCDGSHKGSSFSPVQWMAPASKQVWFCTCKQTATQPLCSGAHKALAASP
jgi:CDGSH iron-sulfur domain-containing protein 3